MFTKAKKGVKAGVNAVTEKKLLEREPMAMLGYGIVSYMQLLQFL